MRPDEPDDEGREAEEEEEALQAHGGATAGATRPTVRGRSSGDGLHVVVVDGGVGAVAKGSRVDEDLERLRRRKEWMELVRNPSASLSV